MSPAKILHPVAPKDRGRAVPPTGVRSHEEFSVDALLAVKSATSISVCIPARDEAESLVGVLSPLRGLVEVGLVDEIVVMDHDSQDRTAQIAEAAGARVVSASSVLPEHGPALGKGDVLWRSLAVAHGDLVVWLDADLTSAGPHYVVGLLGPLLTDPDIVLVRATYDRALGGVAGEGGRVTELLARPVISLLFPELEHVRQPLGGEYAIRRDLARTLPFEPDYGVEMGLLLDVAQAYGVGSIAQVDLGERAHRNRSLRALREQSREVLRACLSRAAPLAPVRGAVPLRPALDPTPQARTSLAG